MTDNTTTVLPDARALLRNLEAACDDLAANRSSETYHNMVHCDRATPYLEALDEARREARAYLSTPPASDAAVPAGEVLKDLLATAYADGAKEVHDFWKDCRPDVVFHSEPDFTEAALDYGRRAAEEAAAAPKVASDTGYWPRRFNSFSIA